MANGAANNNASGMTCQSGQDSDKNRLRDRRAGRGLRAGLPSRTGLTGSEVPADESGIASSGPDRFTKAIERPAYRGRVDVKVRCDGRQRGTCAVPASCLEHVLGTHLRKARATVDPVAFEMIGDGAMVDAEFSGQFS